MTSSSCIKAESCQVTHAVSSRLIVKIKVVTHTAHGHIYHSSYNHLLFTAYGYILAGGCKSQFCFYGKHEGALVLFAIYKKCR